MTNLENSSRRIVGVRIFPSGSLLFCAAGVFSQVVGEWVLVEQDSEVFPAQVVLLESLVETAGIAGRLPELVGLAGQNELAVAGVPWAVEAEVTRRFTELSAAHKWQYLLKEVEARPDRLIVRFAATPEPEAPDYVPLLKELAKIAKTRIELYLVSEDTVLLRPPVGTEFAGWVNGHLKELDPAVLAEATVGEPLLDESEVYRPGQRSKEQPGTEKPVAEKPVASYDPIR